MDYPDPDVIRVNDTFYMVSTTMYFMPGCAILRSYDLAEWELVGYAYDKLDDRQLFVEGNKLLQTFQKLQRRKMVKLYLYFYSLFKSLIIRNLKSNNPKMRCFDLYKLNYICQKFSDKKI